jgi:hypothetical protein
LENGQRRIPADSENSPLTSGALFSILLKMSEIEIEGGRPMGPRGKLDFKRKAIGRKTDFLFHLIFQNTGF